MKPKWYGQHDLAFISHHAMGPYFLIKGTKRSTFSLTSPLSISFCTSAMRPSAARCATTGMFSHSWITGHTWLLTGSVSSAMACQPFARNQSCWDGRALNQMVRCPLGLGRTAPTQMMKKYLCAQSVHCGVVGRTLCGISCHCNPNETTSFAKMAQGQRSHPQKSQRFPKSWRGFKKLSRSLLSRRLTK